MTPKEDQRKPTVNVKEFNMKCPENEQPSSLGTYVIPTQRDLVLFTQRTLLKMFNSYHEKTLLLLKDIKEVGRLLFHKFRSVDCSVLAQH